MNNKIIFIATTNEKLIHVSIQNSQLDHSSNNFDSLVFLKTL